MQPKQQQRATFRPVNTLASLHAPTFSTEDLLPRDLGEFEPEEPILEKFPSQFSLDWHGSSRQPLQSLLPPAINKHSTSSSKLIDTAKPPERSVRRVEMVNERETTRSEGTRDTAALESAVVYPSLPGQPRGLTRPPTFGAPSAMRNPLYASKDGANIFNIRKSRPEHHKASHVVKQPLRTVSNPDMVPVSTLSRPQNTPQIIELPKPTTFAPIAASRPMYSTLAPEPIAQKPTPQYIDLTTGDDTYRAYNPRGQRPRGDDLDPLSSVDMEKANENIKALLQGSIEEDEEDRPQPKLRKKLVPVHEPRTLEDKLKALEVKDATPGGSEAQDDCAVDGLKIRLLPHQAEGVNWMIDREVGKRKKNGVLPKGGILADDMGLGKTIQALSLILCNPRPPASDLEETRRLKIPEKVLKTTLVVAPLALIKQWEAEIRQKVKKSHRLVVLVHHGPSRTKKFEDFKKYDVVITTYQTLSSEHAASSPQENGLKAGCFGVHWYRVLLDEAHSIKNRSAKMTKAAYALNAVYRWCLTGTPMQNNLDELQSLIRFLQIKPYDDMRNWKDQISGPMKAGKGELSLQRLQYFLKAFMKRRTKDVLKQSGALYGENASQDESTTKTQEFKLVARNVETIVCQFDAKESEFYQGLAARTEKSLEEMLKSSRTDYIGAMVLLLRLRQTCNHPELIRGKIRQDKDRLGFDAAPKTPKSRRTDGDVDDVANLFGGLTVATKICDSCRTQLSEVQIQSGSINCAQCLQDLSNYEDAAVNCTSSRKLEAAKAPKELQPQRRRNDRRVLDSDDEDAGEWVVPKGQQTQKSLGTAGDTDDENADGAGRWLGTEDSDTEDDSDGESSLIGEANDDTEDGSSEDDSDESSTYTSDSEDEVAKPVNNHSTRPNKTSSTKIRELIKILHRESSDHKFIVFSEFTSMLDMIEPFLISEGFTFTRYDGSMANDAREASLQRLRRDHSTRILLCSLKCGSLGLNLTAASRVVLIEPFWNPFVEEQAIDRVHRLNQTKDVTVYRLTMANSIEERILALQERKRELAKAAIEGGSAMAKLSMDDIVQLFKRDAQGTRLQGADANNTGVGKKPTPYSPAVNAAADARRRMVEYNKFQAPPQFDAAFGRRWDI